jgi:hypothetical protein
MDTDSDLEGYNDTRADPGILPRTPAEEARMVDNTGDQDMNAWQLSSEIENETHSKSRRLEEEMVEEGLRIRQLVCRDLVQTHKSISMQAPTRSLTEILQLVPEEDARQVIKSVSGASLHARTLLGEVSTSHYAVVENPRTRR